MWSRIKDLFTPRELRDLRDSEERLVQRCGELNERLKRSQKEVVELREKVGTKNTSFLDMDIGDPAPVDTDKRRTYVAAVAGLYKDYLEPKANVMLKHAFLLLEASTNDREFDQAVKGSIYTLREFKLWGEKMVNEQIANQVNSQEEK